MYGWLKIAFFAILAYFLLCLLIATIVASYHYFFRKGKFISTFQETFFEFFIEILNPFNYF